MTEDARSALAAAAYLAAHRDDVHVRDAPAQSVPPGHTHWLTLADEGYRWLQEHGEPAATSADLAVISGQLETVDTKLEKIMTEDAAVQAVTADILADEQAITTAIGTIQAAVTAAAADAVQPSTLTALQSAQAALDSLTATVNSDASSDTPASSSSPASTSGTTPAS
jgi:hypothetical protein